MPQRGVRADRRAGGLHGIELPRDVLLKESQNTCRERMLKRMLAYGADRGLGCRTSVKAGVPNVRRTDWIGLGPQLVIPESTRLGK